MNIKTLFGIFLLIIVIFLISFFSMKSQQNTDIKIALCPTYYYLENTLVSNDYEVIKTDSSSESFNLLKNNSVGLILTGRTAKPSEIISDLDFIIVGKEDYSFLGKESDIIYNDQMQELNFVTDLDEEDLKSKFPIKNIRKVEDVYDFIDNEIIITSWENTDFDKAEIVHVLNRTGEREPLSRKLNIYYVKSNENLASDLYTLIKKEI